MASDVAPRRVAVVGAGWAGCAAAVELAHAGHLVTVFEAARTLGGRAREVELHGQGLDNGQHILLGAYSATLALMRRAGVDAGQTLLRLPLQMRYAPQSGGMDFVAPRLPAPLHLLAALLTAKGLAPADKLSLARFSTTARWMGWQLHRDCSVTELLARFDQTERIVQLLWRPLCLAALNTAPERASAQIFLNVLRDSLGARRAASDMLLPKVDLSTLFPSAAARYVQQRGGAVHLGATVTALRPRGGGWQLDLRGAAPAHAAPRDASVLGGVQRPPRPSENAPDYAPNRGADTASAHALKRAPDLGGAPFDGVVLATPASQSAALLRALPDADQSALPAQLDAFASAPITTCYLQYDAAVRLDRPFFALVDDAAARRWGQFVFDRGQLDPSQSGLLAVVISASGEAAQSGHAALADALARQLAAAFGRAELATPRWSRVITEKRATFACVPGLVRPPNASGWPGLSLAGDYTDGDYPATIEAAVRSGMAAATGLWRG